MPATAEQRAEAQEAHVSAMCQDVILERMLVGLVELLDHTGLDHRVLKGSAVAHLDYPDPVIRSFADVDLLVRSEDWDSAIRVLTSEGWSGAVSEPRPGWNRRFSKGVILRSPTTRRELDLHRTLCLGPFGLTIRLADLWATYTSFDVAACSLRALGPDERFIHACIHTALGDFPTRLVPLRDIAQMGLGGHLDLDRIGAKAKEWQVEMVIAMAIELSWRALELDMDSPVAVWARSLPSSSTQIRSLRHYLRPERSYIGLCVASVRVLPDVRDKIAYVAGLALPDQRFVSERYRGQIDRWRSAARILVAGHEVAAPGATKIRKIGG